MPSRKAQSDHGALEDQSKAGQRSVEFQAHSSLHEMQAGIRRHSKWQTASSPQGGKKHVDALVLISVEMSKGTTADEIRQAGAAK